MKLLIIEDNQAIVDALRRELRKLFTIDAAGTAAEALQKVERHEYNLITLDLGLPDVPGLELCKRLRADGVTIPILVISGQDQPADKVDLLDVGADDYLTKPFRMEELTARLRALIRRSRGGHSSHLTVGDLWLDLTTRKAGRGNHVFRLRPKEFELLEYLMQHAGQVMTRAAILDYVWDVSSDRVWANSVDVHIKYLRDKVDRPFAVPLIQTIHGVGYKLDVPNLVATEST